MAKYISVDIGKAGYFCIMDGDDIQTVAMPKIGKEIDFHRVCEIIRSHYREDCRVVFERLFAMGKNKHAGMSMGRQAGNIEGMCIAMNIPYFILPPQTWQKALFVGVPEIKNSEGKRDTKKMALIAVQRLYPNINLLRTERCKNPDDGLIDAILIATFAKRQNL